MTGQEDRAYEAFINLLADMLLEHLSMESEGTEERRSSGQDETGA